MRILITHSVCVVATVFAATIAHAHDGPNDVIHDLTHRIEDEGATPKLLSARAYELRSIGEYDDAIRDYHTALEQAPDYGPALHGLANTLYRANRDNEAARAANTILTNLDSPGDTAAAHALLARIAQRYNAHTIALGHWHTALATNHAEIDWYLGHAACLRALGRSNDAVDALAEARTKNPSAAIHRAWLSALIDANRIDQAMDEINRGLDQARFKSAWLILRARAHNARQEPDQALRDAQSALEEITARLQSNTPDGYLVASAGAALLLLGDSEAAEAQFEKARTLHVPETYLSQLR